MGNEKFIDGDIRSELLCLILEFKPQVLFEKFLNFLSTVLFYFKHSLL